VVRLVVCRSDALSARIDALDQKFDPRCETVDRKMDDLRAELP
jgi:hypothetical protein